MKERVSSLDWRRIYQSLNEKGYAQVKSFLKEHECDGLKNAYSNTDLYRSIINMQRYRFGMGEYKYFKYPLPEIINSLRISFYEHLVPLANQWMKNLGIEHIFPASHIELIEKCKEKNQIRPTPLILRYEQGGFNTLHQDLYGEVYFPFQILFLLSNPNKDFNGGHFVLTEQVPRAQSIARVIDLNIHDALIFTTNFRPAKSSKGFYRAVMKHGVSEISEGERFALGIIFHDAL